MHHRINAQCASACLDIAGSCAGFLGCTARNRTLRDYACWKEGTLALTMGGDAVAATAGTVVRMPAHVPHAVDAPAPARMLLIMLREPKSV